MTSQNECTLIKWHIEFVEYTIEVNVSSNNIINDTCQLSNVVVYATCPAWCCFKGSCGISYTAPRQRRLCDKQSKWKNVYINVRANLLSSNWSKLVTIDFIDIDHESLSNYRMILCMTMLQSCYYIWYDRVG